MRKRSKQIYRGITYDRLLAGPVEYPRACILCGVKRKKEFFYRKRSKGEDYRRASCSVCDRKRYPPKPWIPRHQFDRRKIYVERKTTLGIREKLLAAGYKSGSREYIAAYAREYALLNPEVKKLSWAKFYENRKAERLRSSAGKRSHV